MHFEASNPFEESFIQDFRTKMKLWTPPQTHHHNNSNQTPFVPEALSKVDFVFVCKDGYVSPLSPLYEGLFKVVSRSEKSFKLHIGSTIETISIDRLKPFHTKDKVIPAQPRPRGRPPKKPILSQSQSPIRSRDLGGTYVEAGI